MTRSDTPSAAHVLSRLAKVGAIAADYAERVARSLLHSQAIARLHGKTAAISHSAKPSRIVEIDGVVVTFVDMSEWRRAVDALGGSESRMRILVGELQHLKMGNRAAAHAGTIGLLRMSDRCNSRADWRGWGSDCACVGSIRVYLDKTIRNSVHYTP
jgi:hypothetical protein